jgi:hypothetical protein
MSKRHYTHDAAGRKLATPEPRELAPETVRFVDDDGRTIERVLVGGRIVSERVVKIVTP